MYTKANLPGVTIQNNDSNGLITLATTVQPPSVLATAASEFALGCIIEDSSTGKTYQNVGSVASPSWNAVGDVVASEITLAEGNVLIGNSSGVATALNAKGSGKILVGNGTTAASVSMSGDLTLAASGAATIANGAVSLAKLASAIQPAAVIKYTWGGQTVGGSVTENFTITGANPSTMAAFAQMMVLGSTPRRILACVISAPNTVTLTFDGDPTNDHVVGIMVMSLL